MIAQGDDVPFRVDAGAVILSAGAYLSPSILHRSGVGPRSILESLGVDVHAELAGVGRHRVDHAIVSVEVQMTAEAPDPADRFLELMLRTGSSLTSGERWDTQIWPGDSRTQWLRRWAPS